MSTKTKKKSASGSKSTTYSALLKAIASFVESIRSFLFALTYPIPIELCYSSKIAPLKRELFADIKYIEASDKRNGQIKILEIGVGPGVNLEFYPENCRLIALDTNHYFEKILNRKLQKHPGIVLEKFVNECAENMSSIASNSVDVVVSTNVHCSVDDSQSVLKEIRRVLVPGGRYFFLEHGLDESHTIRYKWQILTNKTQLWKLTWHGCVFTNFEPEISKFGLLKYNGKRYTIPNSSWFNFGLYICSSLYGGCAIKEK